MYRSKGRNIMKEINTREKVETTVFNRCPEDWGDSRYKPTAASTSNGRMRSAE
jgi:hypothetical protein